MFRTKLTLAGLVVAVAFLGLGSGKALAYDTWYGYAVSLPKTQETGQQVGPFTTDTLAPGGAAPVQSYRFTTDTLAPGGGPSAVSLPASHGFNWADGGIGAAVIVAIALLLLASRRTLQRRKVVAV